MLNERRERTRHAFHSPMSFIPLNFSKILSKTTTPINYETIFWYQMLHGDPLSNRSRWIKENLRISTCWRKFLSTAKCDGERMSHPRKTIQFSPKKKRRQKCNKLQKCDYDFISMDLLHRVHSVSITKKSFCNDLGSSCAGQNWDLTLNVKGI